jgi:hypothetical protein
MLLPMYNQSYYNSFPGTLRSQTVLGMETKIQTEDNIEINIRELMKWLTTMSKAVAHNGDILKLKLAGVIHIIYNVVLLTSSK